MHLNHLWMEPKEEVIFALTIARHEATWMVVECVRSFCDAVIAEVVTWFVQTQL